MKFHIGIRKKGMANLGWYSGSILFLLDGRGMVNSNRVTYTSCSYSQRRENRGNRFSRRYRGNSWEGRLARVRGGEIWKRQRRGANPRMNYLIHCLYMAQGIIIELNARLRLRKGFHASTVRASVFCNIYRGRCSRLNATHIGNTCRLRITPLAFPSRVEMQLVTFRL